MILAVAEPELSSSAGVEAAAPASALQPGPASQPAQHHPSQQPDAQLHTAAAAAAAAPVPSPADPGSVALSWQQEPAEGAAAQAVQHSSATRGHALSQQSDPQTVTDALACSPLPPADSAEQPAEEPSQYLDEPVSSSMAEGGPAADAVCSAAEQMQPESLEAQVSCAPAVLPGPVL